MIMGNSKMITRIKQVARRAGYLTQSEDAFGRKVDAYDGIPLVDLKYYTSVSGSTVSEVPVVPIVDTRKPGSASSEVTGLTDIYAVTMDIANGFHGVSLTGNNLINTYLPDLKAPGAVKTGEVEMTAAVALKNTRSAGVAFVNGKAKTNDNWKADWFLENGYNVEEEKEEEKQTPKNKK